MRRTKSHRRHRYRGRAEAGELELPPIRFSHLPLDGAAGCSCSSTCAGGPAVAGTPDRGKITAADPAAGRLTISFSVGEVLVDGVTPCRSFCFFFFCCCSRRRAKPPPPPLPPVFSPLWLIIGVQYARGSAEMGVR